MPWDKLPQEEVEACTTSTGNGAGHHLNQYTVTMQVMTPRTEDASAKKALINTAKWNEETAQVFIHNNNTISSVAQTSSAPGGGNATFPRGNWSTISVVVDTQCGSMQVMIDGDEAAETSESQVPELGEIDGPFSLQIDDEPRVCLFGDKNKRYCGGIRVLNMSLTARAIPIAELREQHRQLGNAIEKSWAFTRGGATVWEDEIQTLCNAGMDPQTALDTLQKYGGSAAAAAMGMGISTAPQQTDNQPVPPQPLQEAPYMYDDY